MLGMPIGDLCGGRAAGVDATGVDTALANIVVAVSDHRRRMARLLDSLGGLPTEASGMPVAALMRDVAQRLRAGEDRLGVLVAQLHGRPSVSPFPNKETNAWP